MHTADISGIRHIYAECDYWIILYSALQPYNMTMSL